MSSPKRSTSAGVERVQCRAGMQGAGSTLAAIFIRRQFFGTTYPVRCDVGGYVSRPRFCFSQSRKIWAWGRTGPTGVTA